MAELREVCPRYGHPIIPVRTRAGVQDGLQRQQVKTMPSDGWEAEPSRSPSKAVSCAECSKAFRISGNTELFDFYRLVRRDRDKLDEIERYHAE